VPKIVQNLIVCVPTKLTR